MTDMDAFDRLIAREVVHASAPPRPVDDAAIFAAILTATQSPKWRFQSMFSATKFVVAGAIVALFGGFLLSGVLTQQPSDEPLPPAAASASSSPDATTAPDESSTAGLLPGVDLVVEEVEPGVYRAVSDGVRDLESEATIHRVGDMNLIGTHHNVVAGLDGSVWLFGPDAFYRLGDRSRHDWPEAEDELMPAMDDIEVGPDGVIWRVPILQWGPLMSFERGSWTTLRDRAVGVEVQSDGTVWAAWLNDNDRVKVGRVDGDGWEVMPGSVRSGVVNLPGWQPLAVGASPGAEAWVAGAQDGLQRFDGEGWRSEAPPGGFGLRLDVAPDGTVWAMIMPEAGNMQSLALARLDAGAWAVFYDTLQAAGLTHNEGLLLAGTDGSVWISPFSPLQSSRCEGVSNFDGVTLRRYLRDLCVYAMDAAPDGSVWVVAGEWLEGSDPSEAGPIRTYVITPEAVAE